MNIMSSSYYYGWPECNSNIMMSELSLNHIVHQTHTHSLYCSFFSSLRFPHSISLLGYTVPYDIAFCLFITLRLSVLFMRVFLFLPPPTVSQWFESILNMYMWVSVAEKSFEAISLCGYYVKLSTSIHLMPLHMSFSIHSNQSNK